MYREKIEKLLPEVSRPARYIGGEHGSVVKDKSKVKVRFAFCFPDNYDVGMSHLGMKILYGLKNLREEFWCERVFAPDEDFEQVMRREGILLYGLESLEPIRDFDFIGFTLQYELSYTNILNMLELAKVPLHAAERTDLSPIVVAGGPCVCNPEPLADFFDIFILGEGEKVNLELMDLYAELKDKGASKEEFLLEAAKIEGIYVPAFYDVRYNDDGTVRSVTPNREGVPPKIKKRVISDFDSVYYPKDFVVPFTPIVHDRAVVEVLRGCIRGCRFCQAGFIYRPFREKSVGTIVNQTKDLCENTGYEEVSLSSLSTSDYTDINELLSELSDFSKEENVSLSLPSLRVDNFSEEVLEKVSSVKKSGLTFAPEAGTQRLRDVINKNVTDDEIMRSCKIAFEGGYTSVKLYFMMGLPTETDDDIRGMAETARRIIDLFYSIPKEKRGKGGVTVSVSCATFVPKSFTPFEFEPQATRTEISAKQRLLLDSLGTRKIRASWHNYDVSLLEAALARGDRRLGRVIETAFKDGCKMDSWEEHFKPDIWWKAFEEEGLDPEFYACRKREYGEVFPWEHLDYLVSKSFFVREDKRAHEGLTTPNCKEKCSGCGVGADSGGVFCGRKI